MRLKALLAFLLLLSTLTSKSQHFLHFADSIRMEYHIPELAYAIVSSDSVLEMNVSGTQRIHTTYKTKLNDRFHIGSNTKAITALIAAQLVEQRKLSWNTKFLALFPELKSISKKAYYTITLQDLLTFRGKLPSYTYTFDQPTREDIKGSPDEQRYNLAKYFLSKDPMPSNENGLTPSNVDYILAGLMLEKASHQPYKKLITDWGSLHGISFGFDYPNLTDTLQPWGHDIHLNPIAPFDNYKLNWLLSAGNINVDLPDYVKFIQLYLKGLANTSKMLSQKTMEKLLYSLPVFSFGWFNEIDTVSNNHTAFNEGNAGAFITRVEIVKETNRAYIIFTNAATEQTNEGIHILMDTLKKNYY